MSSSFSVHIPKALPSFLLLDAEEQNQLLFSLSLSTIQPTPPSYTSVNEFPRPYCSQSQQKLTSITQKAIHCFDEKKSSLAIQAGAVLLATLEQPAVAVTGENNHEIDLTTALIKVGIIAFWYFLIMPPIIMNWLRVRWYKRKLFEMYVQFMFVFMFFPGLLIWAPFLNFRKLPRDPSLKAPWDTPADPSKVKNAYLKFPWAQVEDYDL